MVERRIGKTISLAAILGLPTLALGQDPPLPLPAVAPPEVVSDAVVARLERPLADPRSVTAAGVTWSCSEDSCTARLADPDVAACRALRARVGPIEAFGRGGDGLSDREVAACNASRNDARPGAVRFGDGNRGRRPPQAGAPALPGARGVVIAPKVARDRGLRVVASPVLERSLAALVERAAEDDYQVYRFDPAGHWNGLWAKEWRGVLVLPSGAALGELVTVRFLDDHDRWIRDDGGRILRDRFHLQPDGTYSKRILDSAGRTAGLFSVSPGGALSVSLDVNGDASIDLMTVLAPDGREYLVVGQRAGEKALDAWWGDGRNPLCLEVDADIAGTEGETAGTIQGCGDRNDDRGRDVGVGPDSGAPTDGGDPLDALCRDVLSRMGTPVDPSRGLVANDRASGDFGRAGVRIIREGFDGETDSKAVQIGRAITTPLWFGTLVLGGVLVDAVTDPLGDYDDMGEGLAEAGKKAAEVGDEDDETTEAEPPDREGPSEKPLPGEGTTPEEVLRGLCTRKQQTWWPGSLDDLDRRYVSERCDDPRAAPSPEAGMDQKELNTWCRRDDGDRTAGNLGGLLGESGGGRSCGPLERPGPDGLCRGNGVVFHPRDPAMGPIAVALGLVIPLPCSGPHCDPAEVP